MLSCHCNERAAQIEHVEIPDYSVPVNELASGKELPRENGLLLSLVTTKYPTLVKNQRNLMWDSGLSEVGNSLYTAY